MQLALEWSHWTISTNEWTKKVPFSLVFNQSFMSFSQTLHFTYHLSCSFEHFFCFVFILLSRRFTLTMSSSTHKIWKIPYWFSYWKKLGVLLESHTLQYNHNAILLIIFHIVENDGVVTKAEESMAMEGSTDETNMRSLISTVNKKSHAARFVHFKWQIILFVIARSERSKRWLNVLKICWCINVE